MSNFFQKTIDAIVMFVLNFREIAGRVLGPAIPTLEWIAAVLSGVLLWLIIYCGVKSKWFINRTEQWMDRLAIGNVGRWRQLRAWKRIVKRTKTGEAAQWKLAIMEADTVMDEILKAGGYRQDTADERFGQLTPEVLSNADRVLEAHRIRNRAAHEPDFVIDRASALEVLKVYKKAFQEFGLLD